MNVCLWEAAGRKKISALCVTNGPASFWRNLPLKIALNINETIHFFPFFTPFYVAVMINKGVPAVKYRCFVQWILPSCFGSSSAGECICPSEKPGPDSTVLPPQFRPTASEQGVLKRLKSALTPPGLHKVTWTSLLSCNYSRQFHEDIWFQLEKPEDEAAALNMRKAAAN